MISIKNLKKSFDGNVIFNELNLDIYDNETIVILGPSGQGKTVLIKAMNRLLEPDKGSVIYDNVDFLKLNKKDLTEFRKQIAFVFQNSALFDFLNVHDNLGLYLDMHLRLTRHEKEERIRQALAFVGLGKDTFAKYPEELSGGMRKRVAIARALIKRPKYVFYDEPTTGLDKTNAEKVSELIKMLQKEISATSIVVTHDIQLMHDVSDRVALLKDKSLFFVGKKEEMSENTLDYLYDGD